MRNLRPAGKLEELTHEMDRYHWNILGLCEMRWKIFGEMSTDDSHKVYFSGEEDGHEYGVVFLVHKDIVSAALGCRPVSSRLISTRLRTGSFNVTIIQVYAPTSGHDDNEVDNFYQQLQEVIDQTPKKDILVVQRDWNAKVGKDVQADWGNVCGPYYNAEKNERGFRLLEFATFDNLVLTNTLGHHKPSRKWTWHNPGMKHHNQIDYILVRK
ncbi:MAG: endonuclease/exonuclease/phosphatase family protein [Candidatus Thiodiazotropha sp.]